MSNSVRSSVTVPLESNPIRLKISRELRKLKALEESSASAAETISIGLCGIAELYKCIGHFLSLPFIQQALSLHQHNKSFLELLEGSEKLLELCNAVGGVTLQTKEASRSLKASLGDNKNNHSSPVHEFYCTRKQIIKSAKKTVLSLRRLESQNFGFSDNEREKGVLMVIREMTCVSIISISVLEAVLYFLAMPITKGKGGNFRLIRRIMRRVKVGCDGEGEGQRKNEMENVNYALRGLMYKESVGVTCKSLEALEVGLEGISNGLETMFTQLAQSRTALVTISRMV